VAVNCWVWAAVKAASAGDMVTGPLAMLTVETLLVPPGPVQVNEKLVVAARGPVFAVPLAARVPLQPPLAVQAVALVELHVNEAALPAATADGFAASVAVGTTLTATLAGALAPPGPVHVNE
jgi:hypothetical protein